MYSSVGLQSVNPTGPRARQSKGVPLVAAMKIRAPVNGTISFPGDSDDVEQGRGVSTKMASTSLYL